jgi:phosphoglycerate dehydrogenase-like enzyme
MAALNVLLTWKPPAGLERIQTCLPGIAVDVATEREAILQSLPAAEVVFGAGFDAELLAAARRLRWIQAASGGVDKLLFPELVASSVQVTSIKPCFDIPGAEYALAAMLAFARRLDYDLRQRATRTFQWGRQFELYGKTLGLIGLGNIGAQIAGRARCFGMRVIGLARRPRPCPPYVDELLPSERLHELLAVSDFVAVAVPITPQTRGMIGPAELRAMKPRAYLIDVSGRPALYDQEALVEALREKRIAGAALQVQPPSDSPLWELDNLLISWHRIGSEELMGRIVELFCENLRRYVRNESLLGSVDKEAGY